MPIFEAFHWHHFVVAIVFAAGTWIYFRMKRTLAYWTDRGVSGPKPYPIVGHMLARKRADLYYAEREWIAQYAKRGEKTYGAFLGPQPALFTADPEHIRQVLISDFSPHFVNRAQIPMHNEIIQQTLLFARDEQWKRIRTIASPALSSAKLRAMNRLMNRCIDALEKYFDDQILASKNEGKREVAIDVKRVFTGFTIDVIAATSFGTETNANNNQNSQNSTDNSFLKNAKLLFQLKSWRLMFLFLLPARIAKWSGVDSIFDMDAFNFFVDLIRHVLSGRRANNNDICEQRPRNDFIQMMLDARVDERELTNNNFAKLIANDDDDNQDEMAGEKNKAEKSGSISKKMTENEVIATCFIFFIAGFETTSTTLTFAIYELARNSAVQERLCAELREALDRFSDKNDNQDNDDDDDDDDDQDSSSSSYFDAVMSCAYLDAIVRETLRLYPPVSLMARECASERHHVGDIPITKGVIVAIPIVAIHQDPDYYPDPMRYDPERFMPQNRDRLTPYTYIPFSAGPRNCLGMRFALQEIKLCLARIVRRYRFVATERTISRLRFDKGNSMLQLVEPISLRVERR